LLHRIGIHPGEASRDVGCGGGIGLGEAESLGAGFSAGVEISDVMLSGGRCRFRREIVGSVPR